MKKKMRDLAAAKSINGGDNLLIARNDGWSVYSDSSRSIHYPTIYLSNSDSHVNKSFKLPPIRRPIHEFSKCLINYPTVMLVYDNFKSAVYYDCERDGGDKKWNKGSLVEKEWTEQWGHYTFFCDVIVFDGKFYGIDYMAEIVEIVTQGGRGGIVLETQCPHPRCVLPLVRIDKVQLVACREHLFVVTMLNNLKLEVFVFQFSNKKFYPVYNIGDRVFFLSNNYSWTGSGEELVTMGNCIYFTQDNNETTHIFNLEDDTLSTAQTRNICGGGSLSPSYDGLLPVLRIRNGGNQVVRANESKNTTTKTEEQEGLESMIMIKLPLHMQEHVAKYVKKGQDYLNFRLVCTRWRSITPTRQWQAAPCVSGKNGFDYPWLMSLNRETGTCKLSEPKENASYLLKDLELVNCLIRCSKDGWLLVSKGLREVFLYEPFTKKKIQLPNLKKYCLDGICLSDTPTSSKLTIFGFFQLRHQGIQLVFLNIGDSNWSTVAREHTKKPFTASYSNPVYFRGLFYCLSQEGSIGVFDSITHTWNIISAPPTPFASLPLTTKIVSSFLIPYNEELFSVHVSNRAGELVRVFKLKCTCESGDDKWEEVSSLGNIALFVSESGSFALTVREERMKNNIYFPCLSYTGNNHVFYSMESGTFCTFGTDRGVICTRTLYDTKEQLHSTWIQPRLVSSSW